MGRNSLQILLGEINLALLGATSHTAGLTFKAKVKLANFDQTRHRLSVPQPSNPAPGLSILNSMRLFASIVLLSAFSAGALYALEREPNAVFEQRRRALAEQVDSPVLLFGFASSEGQLGRSGFRQENSFYYLTGWNEPGAALLIVPGSGSKAYRETLFVPRPDPIHSVWTGATLDPQSDDAHERTGCSEVLPIGDLEGLLRQALKRSRRLYSLLGAPPGGLGEPVRRKPDRSRIDRLAPGARLKEIREKIDAARYIKSTGELRLIQKAIDASIAGHRAAWRRIRPDVAEYQVLGAMKAAMIDRGALRVAYPPIVGAGANSVTLHYSLATKTLARGELILMDVGGEYGHYAADITRTVPVDGRFTTRQRKIYQAVLACQREVIAAASPGMTLNGQPPKSLTQIAGDCFERHEEGLSAHFLHSVGHHVGLDVHDPGESAELKPGMVITIEPGLYLADEGFGIRIEDMAVVTEDGVRLLSDDLPKEIDEIEQAMSSAAAASE